MKPLHTSPSLALLFATGCFLDHSLGDDAVVCPPVFDDTCYATDCCADTTPGHFTATCGFACPAGNTNAMACDARCRGGTTRDAGIVEFDAAPILTCADLDCALTFTTCCGSCDPGSEDVVAMPAYALEAHREEICGEEPVACAPCPRSAPHLRNFHATCEFASCGVVDLRTSDFARCESDDECVLRPSDCCGYGAHFLSLNAAELDSWEDTYCREPVDCDCEPPSREGHRAFCGADGFCQLEELPILID